MTPSRLELFAVDLTPLGGTALHFAAGTNELGRAIVWQGITYTPAAIEAEGFEQSGSDAVARPKLRIGNVSGALNGVLFDYDELRGALVSRIRTLGKYLDAVNFRAGNPSADPTQEFPREIYTIDRVSRDDGVVVEFELGAPHDVLHAQLPALVA